jgi:hypothetical protein
MAVEAVEMASMEATTSRVRTVADAARTET